VHPGWQTGGPRAFPGPAASSQNHGDIPAVSVLGDVGEWLPAANTPMTAITERD
jgi:hypothetical protein